MLHPIDSVVELNRTTQKYQLSQPIPPRRRRASHACFSFRSKCAHIGKRRAQGRPTSDAGQTTILEIDLAWQTTTADLTIRS